PPAGKSQSSFINRGWRERVRPVDDARGGGGDGRLRHAGGQRQAGRTRIVTVDRKSPEDAIVVANTIVDLRIRLIVVSVAGAARQIVAGVAVRTCACSSRQRGGARM